MHACSMTASPTRTGMHAYYLLAYLHIQAAMRQTDGQTEAKGLQISHHESRISAALGALGSEPFSCEADRRLAPWSPARPS